MSAIKTATHAATALLLVTALSACGGGGFDDPDFDGPEWEGTCPTAEQMRQVRPQYAEQNVPEPPYHIYCPAEYEASLR